MHVHSFLPLVGLTLLSLTTAEAPGSSKRYRLKRATNGICDVLPTKWSYDGCYFDDPSNRALNGPSYCDDNGMRQESCIEFCDARGYPIAGVEFGSECYCGYSLGSVAEKKPESDCNKPCTGASDEVCGAGGRLNVFTNGDTAPSVVQQSGDFSSLGCYSDSASARTLTTRLSLPGNVRVSDCTTACDNAGYVYAGLEFGDECFCGTSISNGASSIAASNCNMACTADKTELCGGRGAINVYKSSKTPVTAGQIPSGWTSKNCYSDSVSGRALAQKISLASNTVENCINACAGQGYSLAGVEYGSECFCGNTIDNGQSPATSGCDMACSGNKAEICGGAARINIYQKTPVYHHGARCDFYHYSDASSGCSSNCFCDPIFSGTNQGQGYCYPAPGYAFGNSCNTNDDCPDSDFCDNDFRRCITGSGCSSTFTPTRKRSPLLLSSVSNSGHGAMKVRRDESVDLHPATKTIGDHTVVINYDE